MAPAPGSGHTDLANGFLGYDDKDGARHLVNAFGISEIVYTEITE